VGFVLSVLLVVFGVAIVVWLVTVYTRQVATAALTDPFRAGEAIVEGRIPAKWVAQIERRQALRGALRLIGRDVSAKELILAKIDKLYRFFENSPFFENDSVRELMLTELRETRARWAGMTSESLMAEHVEKAVALGDQIVDSNQD
jgi:hypothetical protein